MYQKLKQLLKLLVPKRILLKYEDKFRSFYYQLYRGDKFQCNICNRNLSRFILLENGEKICPACGSLPRSRRLWSLLTTRFLKDGIRILDFSPSRSIYNILKNNHKIHYTSSDYSGEFLSDEKYDITQLPIRNDTYDLILCYHILEHVENDLSAMNELFRVIKSGGCCLIQTPFKAGDIYEDPAIVSSDDRLKFFGQSDHVRIYSVNGLKERLSKANLLVEIMEFTEKPANKYGFKEKEFVILAYK